MKTNLKAIVLVALIISTSIFVCCTEAFEESELQLQKKTYGFFNGKICDGKKILEFSTLTELQQAHYELYQQYVAGNEEEQVLIDYENDNDDFYSLRKKVQDMDEGVIPDDPNFDETNFTFDPVFEAMLNQDGMIIIDERLYIWDSGCVIQSIPFSCQNYKNLLEFRTAAESGDTALMHKIFVVSGMKNHNICDDKNFDFEAISENEGNPEEGEELHKINKNGCGYEVVLNTALESCQGGFYTYNVSFESIAPIGSNAYNVYYILPIVGNASAVEVYDPLLGTWGAIPLFAFDANLGYLVPFDSEEITIRIPNNAAMPIKCAITVQTTINTLTGNSCLASDIISVDNSCPFSIVAIKNFVSETESQWTFSLIGAPGCPITGGTVSWNFGDGNSINGGFTVTHTYTHPCDIKHATVTATINDALICGTVNKLFTKDNIPYGNPCMRENYTFDTEKDKVDGKRVRLRAKIKRNIFGKSVFKNVFKLRKNGSKTITSVGTIYEPSANNSNCIPYDISSIMPSKTTNGKKRNKQKEKFSNLYHISASDPYRIEFSHSSGYNYTLLANGLYCSQ